MLEKRLFESPDRALVEDEDVAKVFWQYVCEFAGEKKLQVLTKVGGFDFEIPLRPNFLGSTIDIKQIDESDFISRALETSWNYKRVDDETYIIQEQLLNGILKEGEHIIAINNEPVFKVSVEKSGYAYKSMIFSIYGAKKKFLKHTPNLDVSPAQFEVELSTKSRDGSDRVLGKAHDGILDLYETGNFNVLDVQKE
jgi:hypothetical protein